MNELDRSNVNNGDDVLGHGISSGRADAETAEGDEDVEGHSARGRGADAESAEGDDDVEGHVYVEEPHDLSDRRI